MQKNTLATFIVAALISGVSATSFAGDLMVTNITDCDIDQQIGLKNHDGIRIGAVEAPISERFGNISPVIVSDISGGMNKLVRMVNPPVKIMVFRDADTYNPLKMAALEVAATTQDRIEQTIKFGVQNALTDAGLLVSPEQYLGMHGIVITANDLVTESHIIGKTYEHLMPRLQPGGDLFEITGGKYTPEAMLRANADLV